MQILLLIFVSVLVRNWPFSHSHRFYTWIHLWLFSTCQRDDRLNLSLPQNTYLRGAVHYPLTRNAVDSELSENKKKLNSWVGLKDLDFGSDSGILLTEHSGRRPLCLNMDTSTKNQCCKTAVVKINTAKYTCRVWGWQKKEMAQNFLEILEATPLNQLKKESDLTFYAASRKGGWGWVLLLSTTLRGDCWHLEKHKKRQIFS